ncbi:hypothetical protein DBR43_05960 [Pedobacter sp. KBW06]|nr:hypothetical protein DBR43_05960 [Pedobacter sp. KBW06]
MFSSTNSAGADQFPTRPKCHDDFIHFPIASMISYCQHDSPIANNILLFPSTFFLFPAGYKNKKPPVIQREASLTKYKLNELTQIYNLKTKNTIYFNKKS